MKNQSESFTVEQVAHIAKLANLSLSDAELKKYAQQLGETVGAIAVLQEVDTENVKPTDHVTGLTNVFDADEPRPSLPMEVALSNVQNPANPYIRVPAVFE